MIMLILSLWEISVSEAGATRGVGPQQDVYCDHLCGSKSTSETLFCSALVFH